VSRSADRREADLHDRARQWHPGLTRAVVLKTVRFLLRLIFAAQVTGAEHVPSEGAVLLVSNHRSLSDVLFQAGSCPRTLRWMGKAELFSSPSRARLMGALGAFPVRRGGADAAAIETARMLLEHGQAVAIYPEGKLQFRSEATIGEPHSGAGRLALETGAQLLPMAMVGTDHLLAAAFLRRHHRVRISFGEPIPAPEDARVGFFAGDREAAKRLIVDTVWPQVGRQVKTLRERPAVAATGGSAFALVIGALALRRRRRAQRQ
jgi:1-acyl-sn-glycerol-3-phosphate acyltransferase